MAKAIRTAKPSPTSTVSSHQTKLDELVTVLSPTEVGRVPARAKKRAQHIATVAAAALEDAPALLTVPLESGHLQQWEIQLFPVAAKVAVDLADAVSADRLGASGLSPADAAWLATVRADQGLLLSAFQRLRFKGDSAKLKELRDIARGDRDDVIDAYDDSSRLIALATSDAHRAWLSSLPRGESKAVARLEAAHERLGGLSKVAQSNKAVAERRARLRRVWTVLGRIERRVRDAADYLFHKKARRAEYNAFVAPSGRKKKTAPATKKEATE
jgi:hypothetical protein